MDSAMPSQVVPLKPLSRQGKILTAPLKIHKEGGKIVLSQKTRLWFRLAICLWAMVVLMTPFMIYDEFFNSHTTNFTCDRATGICAVNGSTRDVPPLAQIRRAVMDHDFNRRDGANWGINLITSDGKKYAIEQQRAIKDSVIADYRSTVKAINAYLADPGQQKLDRSFTYRASLSEKLKSVFYLFFGVVTLFVGLALWTRWVYTFEPGRVTVAVRGPLQRATQQIAVGEISAIEDHQVLDRRQIDLKLSDTSRIPVIEVARTETPQTDSLARELAELLGKPLESAPR